MDETKFQKLQKLQKLLEVANESHVTPDEVATVVHMTAEAIKAAKEDCYKEDDSIREDVGNALVRVDKKIDTVEAKRLADCKELESKIRSIELTPGEKGEPGESVKGDPGLPGKDGSPDTGEQIITKINDVPEKGPKIKASHIEDLPQATNTIIREAIGVGGFETPIKTSAGVRLSKDAQGAWVLPPSGGTGTVTSVASADGSITVTNPTTTPDLSVVQSPKLTTARTIAITGDLSYTSPAFDGSGNVTAAATLPTVNSNVGAFTNANITVDAKGRVTAAANGSSGSGSGITRSVNSISADTTAGATASTDYVYLMTGSHTLTLPTAVSNTNQYSAKAISGTTTVATTSAQTINGSSSVTITAGSVLTFISDNANWHVI